MTVLLRDQGLTWRDLVRKEQGKAAGTEGWLGQYACRKLTEHEVTSYRDAMMAHHALE